jgi:hypothetical protein
MGAFFIDQWWIILAGIIVVAGVSWLVLRWIDRNER